MRVAFYAPMKAPDDPVPSGDRTMARLLTAALQASGHRVDLASRLRSYMAAPDAKRQIELRARSELEARRLIESWEGGRSRPDLWFTYHNYYKAPDLIGPAVAARIEIPYVLAEASHAPKRAAEWPDWHQAAGSAIEAADAILCFTRRDRASIERLVTDQSRLVDLPPFIDIRGRRRPDRDKPSDPVKLVTVAMMRPGDKVASYRFLAAALADLGDLAWTLTIVGDGPARSEVEALFAPLPSERLSWRGTLNADDVATTLAAADLFLWPGFGEAFGLAYLEAQAAGIPVVALDTAGVSSVVEQGRSGLLVDVRSPEGYATAVRRLIEDGDARRRLGASAAAFVRSERSAEVAASRLDDLIHRLVRTERVGA